MWSQQPCWAAWRRGKPVKPADSELTQKDSAEWMRLWPQGVLTLMLMTSRHFFSQLIRFDSFMNTNILIVRYSATEFIYLFNSDLKMETKECIYSTQIYSTTLNLYLFSCISQ